MIPVKLELHNFLAYHDPEPLDFTGLHLACLVATVEFVRIYNVLR